MPRYRVPLHFLFVIEEAGHNGPESLSGRMSDSPVTHAWASTSCKHTAEGGGDKEEATSSIGKIHVSGRFVEDKVLLPPISVVERHDLHTNAFPSVRVSL